MAQAQRLLLARKACGPGAGQLFRQEIEVGLPLALAQRHLELELAVEMVLDNALVTPGDEDEMLDTGLPRLVAYMLDHWPVDDRQHFLGHGLGGGQEPGPKAGHGENSFADRFHAAPCRMTRLSDEGRGGRCQGMPAGGHYEESLTALQPYMFLIA